ncbi:MAG: DNA polymerase III subunit delta, partial [Gammaproteobacteria bacterium]|nr:DNA polymerase III subunit delta [Gammaproteobacteria bacterium]
LQQHRINAAPEAVRLIAERVEGNLLAARQEIDKLVLLYGPGSLDASQVSAAVTDSARYDLFQLVDMALLGQGERAVRMLDGLRAEGTEPVLILWALTREIRDLCSKAFLIAQGEPRAKVMASVWEKRKAAISRGLDHHTVRGLRRLLQCCNHIDRLVKGMRNGNVWDELLQLTMEVANSPVLQSKPARSV